MTIEEAIRISRPHLAILLLRELQALAPAREILLRRQDPALLIALTNPQYLHVLTVAEWKRVSRIVMRVVDNVFFGPADLLRLKIIICDQADYCSISNKPLSQIVKALFEALRLSGITGPLVELAAYLAQMDTALRRFCECEPLA